ncbi:MAG: glycosyltransferase family 4 protein [Candidatus Levybacteria bacterium]|nr:glycosyltransferase family 4 protein [Candidatus Levybacteria bacterium]
MDILILNWRDIENPQKGGAEIIIYELAKRLIEKGNSVTWFCESFKRAKKNENIKGIKVIRKGSRYTVGFYAMLFYKSLKRKPDVVLDCVNTFCWQTPLYVEKKRRIFYANQSARKVFFYQYPFPISVFGFLFEPLQYLSYKKTSTICYSQSIKDDLITFGLPKDNINVFPLGIDHARYKMTKKSKDPSFIFVSRLVDYKRPKLCVEAAKVVIKKYPEMKLYIVGYGPQEDELKKLIKKNNLNSNVFIVNNNNNFLEKNSKDIKVKLMQEAWALILCSVKEGWGMVVTEAAACGTPSIVSNVTGLKDSVIHNKTGFILSENPSPLQLSNAIIKIIEDEKLRQNLSREAFSFAKTFSWEKSFDAFYDIVKKTIKQN